MRFGSVEFFKVLIKTVLAVIFFVPLILAVVFGVLFAKNSAQLSEIQTKLESLENENRRLTVMTDMLVNEKAGTVESYNEIFLKSGISYEELIAYINEKNGIDAKGLYEILSEAGISDKDIIAMAASKQTVNGENFYEIMSRNGISDKI